MASNNKCCNCGSLDLDRDPARGDVVCTNCGTVLEQSAIVSEVQFEENAHGGSSALGQFVSSDSKGGSYGFGGSFHTFLGKESREVTLLNAKRRITNLAQQLRLNQHCIDTAFNIFKMALTQQLTRGRKTTHVIAACLYITCRTENTAHMLIDFSDVLLIDVYELGRTYLRLSQALCIRIPSMDPCVYICRYASRLEFGDKTHEVSMTALRLVQRMKRDSIHTGRRPSGLCGAALLIAARLHEFSRSVEDVTKIVKVHDSTLRKRLLEFGETPSSSLTLEEFMNVDLEEEQDPPSFKMARKKDRERLQKLMEEKDVDATLNDLQIEIERQLEEQTRSRNRALKKFLDREAVDAETFLEESVDASIRECLRSPSSEDISEEPTTQGLGPSIASMGLLGDTPKSKSNVDSGQQTEKLDTGEIDLAGIDDDEIDSYIMSEKEAFNKDSAWNKVNAVYLEELKVKEEKRKKEEEEGKPEKKKRRTTQKRGKSNSGVTSSTPGEAIEKMLQEKKISSKINYDVLKSLSVSTSSATTATTATKGPTNEATAPTETEVITKVEEPSTKLRPAWSKRGKVHGPNIVERNTPSVKKDLQEDVAADPEIPAADPEVPAADPEVPAADPEVPAADPEVQDQEELEDYDDIDADDDQEAGTSIQQMLSQRNDDGDNYYGGYEEDYY